VDYIDVVHFVSSPLSKKMLHFPKTMAYNRFKTQMGKLFGCEATWKNYMAEYHQCVMKWTVTWFDCDESLTWRDLNLNPGSFVLFFFSLCFVPRIAFACLVVCRWQLRHGVQR
jgi:hypothetical protein